MGKRWLHEHFTNRYKYLMYSLVQIVQKDLIENALSPCFLVRCLK